MSDVSNFINIKKILNDSSIDARISLGPAVGHSFLNNKEEKDKASYQRRCPFLILNSCILVFVFVSFNLGIQKKINKTKS